MINKFPTPPNFMMNTDVEIIQEIDGEDGVTEDVIYTGKCYYDESARRVMNENKQIIELSGIAIVYEDIQFKKAYVRIGDTNKSIYRVSRPRNPDGTIYSTEMELI